MAALGSGSAQAAQPPDEGDKPVPYVPWHYPAQLPSGSLESGSADLHQVPSPAAFLTLPFLGTHFVTAIFDHCGPNYIPDGRVCRYDGAIVSASAGSENGGYALTPGSRDFVFYDGHDGFDYGLYNENVVAAAPGRVTHAGWDRPSCESCGFGRQVLIDHGNGFTSRYGHLSFIQVHDGQQVRRGQVLGLSGSSGSSSGEHLHFGVYRSDHMIAIDPHGWSGGGPDPWPLDAGDLWLGGAPRFAPIALPSVTVRAEPDPDSSDQVMVTWASLGSGVSFDVKVVEGDLRARAWLSGVPTGAALFKGEQGRAYWFVAEATTDLGWTDLAATGIVLTGSPPVQP